jgi:hypothetical protein
MEIFDADERDPPLGTDRGRGPEDARQSPS